MMLTFYSMIAMIPSMTTPKVIVSSTEFSDRRYMTGNAAIASSLIVAVVTGLYWSASQTLLYSVIMGAFSFIVTFGIALFTNRRFATKRADFIQSVKDAVEKETGHVMTTRGVMAFLFSGEAMDEKGTTLKVKQTNNDISILKIN